MNNLAIASIILVLSLVLQGKMASEAASQKRVLKVGFITVGPVNDLGYNYANDQGRQFMQTALANRVSSTVVENIPESAEAERVMERMIANGVRLIFPTSFGYFEPALKVARRHPEVIFECCGRVVPENIKNVGSYFAKQYEPMYVCGIVAGRMTKRNDVGFIIGHAVPQVVQNINAFTLGLRSVNADARVHVVCTNSWSDATAEAGAAKGLIKAGADVIAMHLDNPSTVIDTAEKYGAMIIGYHTNLKERAPKGWLTGEMWNWGPLFVKIANSVCNHSWMAGNYRYEMSDGYSKLAPFGLSVPAKTQLEALRAIASLQGRTLNVFKGPLKDRDGKERIASGKIADTNDLDSMNWFVPGVEGALEKR